MSKKKMILWVLLGCICIACTVGYLGLPTSAASAEIVDCDIPAEYQKGEEIIMPDGKVSYKGQEKEPEIKYVVFPSGKAKSGETIVWAEIYPDFANIKEQKGDISQDELKALIKREIDMANDQMSTYKRVKRFKLRDTEFEKTTTKKIKR